METVEWPTQCSVLSAGNLIDVLFQKAGRCVNQACSLFILDKGKPVVRPGRKAKGRRETDGSLAAERVKTIYRRDEEEAFY
jgi:hypothetical protein